MPINKPTNKNVKKAQKLVCIPLTREDIVKDFARRAKSLSKINKEFDDGFEFMRKFPQSVTIYGSARFTPANPHYQEARALAGKLAKEGYAVVSGGGPGIMEAANRGAKEAGGVSIGLNIKLPSEQTLNKYTTDSMEFSFFFSRKTILSFSSEAYIYFPGGFGTLDELFEVLTLVQTKKIRKVPIILVGSDFWKPLDQYIGEQLNLRHGTVSGDEMRMYRILDNHNAIIREVKKAPIRC